MTKITITIEDLPDGKVSVKAEPNFEMMARMDASGHGLTSAHGYALRALNAIREASREQAHSMNVYIPRARN